MRGSRWMLRRYADIEAHMCGECRLTDVSSPGSIMASAAVAGTASALVTNVTWGRDRDCVRGRCRGYGRSVVTLKAPAGSCQVMHWLGRRRADRRFER